ncbi:DUF2134 domain-containing protein [Pararobbsia alpina]|uniref:TadG family pilus assembly protein n=1 Tax=Pararobbsia alpina TaxID=621374 RepID=UPI0039A75602
MRQPIQRQHAARAMRGSIAITAALWLMTIIVALGVVDVGHVWWQRRHLQGVADMMALAAAQRLDDTCGGAQTVVAQIATSNGYSGAYTVNCGHFDTKLNQFMIVGAPYTTVNGIYVQLNSNVKYWFMPMVGSKGEGIAVASTSRVVNIGAFTLGTTLATLQTGNSALLNGVLSALLGSSVNLDVVSYTALAKAQIKLSNLAVQLNSNGANDIVQMLATKPTLKTLITAIDNAVPSGDASKPFLSQLVGWANTSNGGNSVPMNGANNQTGLLDIGLENINAASNATIDALDAVMVAAMIANTTSSNVAPITVDTSLLPNLPNGVLASKVQLSLGQPPVLAVGEAGSASAVARSQQVQLFLQLGVNVGSGALPVPNLPTLLSVSLPVLITVAPATASLSQTQCGAGPGDSSSTVQITPGIAAICISDNASKIFSGSSSSCTPATTVVTALNNLVTVTSLGGSLQLAPGSPQAHTFIGVSNQISQPNPVYVNSNAAGSDLATALSTSGNSLIGNLTTNLTVNVGGIPISLQTFGLGTVLQNVTTGIVGLLTPALNAVIPQVLGLVGAQVGQATVTDVSLTCGNVQLVK